MGNIGVIHEDVVGFGDGKGFQVLNEEDKNKVYEPFKSPQEPTKAKATLIAESK